MTDYLPALLHLYPNARWSLNGEDYDGLVWTDDDIAKPTREQLEAVLDEAHYHRAYAKVEAERKAAYERDADPVFFRWQRGTATEQDWLDAVQAVKDAHPYPEQP